MKRNLPQLKRTSNHNFETESALALAEMIRASLEKHARISVALSGGSTPLPIYKLIGAMGLDWHRIDFFLVDERCVPSHSPDSNFGNIAKVLFNAIDAAAYPMVQEELSFEQCAVQYEQLIKEKVRMSKGFPCFDIVVLGMGLDGHTASLFPGSPALSNATDWVVLNPVQTQATDRITMTFPLLENAEKLVLLIKGEPKRRLLEDAHKLDLPISKLLAKLELILN